MYSNFHHILEAHDVNIVKFSLSTLCVCVCVCVGQVEDIGSHGSHCPPPTEGRAGSARAFRKGNTSSHILDCPSG